MRFAILLLVVASMAVDAKNIGPADRFLQRWGRSDQDSKIVGGSPVDLGDRPYQIVLYWFGGFICGGSIYDADTVITASHCCDGNSASSLSIGAGGLEYDDMPIVRGLYHLPTVLRDSLNRPQ